jgi:GntR family transcriptional repressor for pyruvate dehydrogenase complex
MFKQRTTRDMLLGQHRAINDALQAARPPAHAPQLSNIWVR